MLAFDSAVGAHGLAEAARRLQRVYVRDVRVFGRDRLPPGSIEGRHQLSDEPLVQRASDLWPQCAVRGP